MNDLPHPRPSPDRARNAASDPPHVLDWPVRVGAVNDVLSELACRIARRRQRRLRALTAAAAIILTAGIGGYVIQRRVQESASSVTGPAIVSQPERRVLDDGSNVELNAGAKISLRFTETERRVWLEEGDAHFGVTRDPARPFIVVAGEIEFRAVGTAFSVQRTSNAVELLVTEGSVAVEKPRAGVLAESNGGSQPARPPAALAIVDAGAHMVVPFAPDAAAPKVEPLAAAEIRERTAWRVPLLELSGTELGEAVPIFCQHRGIQVVLADPELARVRLSGVLRADNVETLLSLLEESNGVRVERRSATEIMLHRR